MDSTNKCLLAFKKKKKKKVWRCDLIATKLWFSYTPRWRWSRRWCDRPNVLHPTWNWFFVWFDLWWCDGWLLVLTSLWRKAPSCLGFHGRCFCRSSIVWDWFLVKSGCWDCARVSGTVGVGVRFEGVFVNGSLWFLGGVAGGSERRRVFSFVLCAGGSVVAWVVGGRG
jgi:hypothetical protein